MAKKCNIFFKCFTRGEGTTKVLVSLYENKFPIEVFGTFLKRKRSTASVIRFKRNCRNPKRCLAGMLKAKELAAIEFHLVKITHNYSFADEISKLRGRQKIKDLILSLTLTPCRCSSIVTCI